jgi:hypothetical protein
MQRSVVVSLFAVFDVACAFTTAWGIPILCLSALLASCTARKGERDGATDEAAIRAGAAMKAIRV